MRYAVFELAEVTEEIESITKPSLSLAIKSLDGSKVLLKFVTAQMVEGKTILNQEEIISLLQTEEWKNDVQVRL